MIRVSGPFVPTALVALVTLALASCSGGDSGGGASAGDGGDGTGTGTQSGGNTGGGGNGGGGNGGGDSGTGTGANDGGDSGTGGSTDASTDGSVIVKGGTCGTKSPATGFIATVTVTVDGAPRTYALTVPASYDGTKLFPLVVGFHGDGGSGASYRSSFPIEAAANGNAIFAWPNGTNANNGHSFDQGDDPPANKDVDFFEAMVAQIRATYCIEPKKLFIHGMSGGAYFVNQLARWKAPEITAAAPQSGGGPYGINGSDYNAMGNLTVNGAVPVFIVHGNADSDVPLTEGEKSYAYWQTADQTKSGTTNASPSPCVKQNGGVASVYWCVIPGMGHTIWSGAAAGIWQFFAAQ